MYDPEFNQERAIVSSVDIDQCVSETIYKYLTAFCHCSVNFNHHYLIQTT